MAHPKIILLLQRPPLPAGRDGGNVRGTRLDQEEEGHSVECSGRISLECKRCGETKILLGLEEDWRSERTDFACACGRNLTLKDRTNEEVRPVKRLLSGSIGTSSGDGGAENYRRGPGMLT